MKKLLALLLLSPLMSGEDIEYPIELTCIFGQQITYFYLTESQENSWIQFNNPRILPSSGANERLNNRKIKLKKYEIDEDMIVIKKYLGTYLPQLYVFEINRKTGGSNAGSCQKGLKSFTEKKF